MTKTTSSSYYNKHGYPMTPAAFHALELAYIWPRVAPRYRIALMVHHGVTIPLLRLARQLVAIDKIKVEVAGTQAAQLPLFLQTKTD